MAIVLKTQPQVASAALEAADVQALITAITGVVALPPEESAEKVFAMNIIVQPTGAGTINVRFNQ